MDLVIQIGGTEAQWPLHIDDYQVLRQQINRHITLTPLLTHPLLNQLTGGQVYLKAESLQTTGSFKLRGVAGFITNFLAGATCNQGLVAYSSGNHAQAVAYMAQTIGVPAWILMPHDAPLGKTEKTRAYGAQVVFYDRLQDDRAALAEALAAEKQAVLIPPFDHPWIAAGQGTLVLEMLDQLKLVLPASSDSLLDECWVPVSGGGLLAGCAHALQLSGCVTSVYGVEPDGYDDTSRSLQAGTRVTIVPPSTRSICDALLLTTPGEWTFKQNQNRLAGVLTVTDTEVLAAMHWAFDHLKLVLEPGGAVALAALLSQKRMIKGRRVGLVLSGGNVDETLFVRCFQTPYAQVFKW